MIDHIPKRFRVPLALVALLLGAYLLFVALEPGGPIFNRDRPLTRIPGRMLPNEYGPLVFGGACLMIAWHLYKNRDRDKKSE